jgi:hypothetical protein
MTIADGFKIFDPRLLLEIGSGGNFKETVKRALFKTLRGKATLKGTGDLINLYPYLESEANENGVVGVIWWGGGLMKVSVSAIVEKDGKKSAKYFFTRSEGHYKYSELKIKLPMPKLDKDGKTVIGTELQDQTFYANRSDLVKDDDKLFAILENDVKMTPDLMNIDEDLEKGEFILEAIFDDVAKSKKRFFFVFSQEPVKEEWGKVIEMLEKDIIGYVAMPKSGQDVGVDEKTGVMKEGIDPDKIELKVIQPENKGRDLWADYRNWKREMLWKYGIKVDVLEDKKERANNPEVESSNSYFDNIDNERRICRENFFKWCIKNWADKALNVDYSFTYN